METAKAKRAIDKGVRTAKNDKQQLARGAILLSFHMSSDSCSSSSHGQSDKLTLQDKKT